MRILTIVIALAACGGDTKSPDAGNLPACTGQVYDSCNPAASNCMGSDVCKAYGTSGFSVCVPPQGDCTTNGCPPQSGGGSATCNTMGFCKPTAANATCMAP